MLNIQQCRQAVDDDGWTPTATTVIDGDRLAYLVTLCRRGQCRVARGHTELSAWNEAARLVGVDDWTPPA